MSAEFEKKEQQKREKYTNKINGYYKIITAPAGVPDSKKRRPLPSRLIGLASLIYNELEKKPFDIQGIIGNKGDFYCVIYDETVSGRAVMGMLDSIIRTCTIEKYYYDYIGEIETILGKRNIIVIKYENT